MHFIRYTQTFWQEKYAFWPHEYTFWHKNLYYRKANFHTYCKLTIEPFFSFDVNSINNILQESIIHTEKSVVAILMQFRIIHNNKTI